MHKPDQILQLIIIKQLVNALEFKYIDVTLINYIRHLQYITKVEITKKKMVVISYRSSQYLGNIVYSMSGSKID